MILEHIKQTISCQNNKNLLANATQKSSVVRIGLLARASS